MLDAVTRRSLLLPQVLSREELERAVGAVFCELRPLLEAREGERLAGAWRRQLYWAQEQAVVALAGRPGVAKRLQLEASGGRPLTVCFGRRTRELPLPSPFELHAFTDGDGCGVVHPDSTGLRRPSFRLYCERCRRRQTELKRRTLAEAVAYSQGRMPVPLFDEAGNPSEPAMGWWGTCSRCGEEFVTASSRVRRCERCRQGHR